MHFFKYFILILLSFSVINADVYYSKVEPFEEYLIKSNVSGQVTFANEKLEGQVSDKKRAVILIDSYLDEKELYSTSSKKSFLQERLDIIRQSYANLEKILNKKRKNYDKIKNLRNRSAVEKDNEFYDLINTQNNYLNLRGQTIDIKNQIRDLNYRIDSLRKTIKDKKIYSNNMFIDELLVKKGDFVTLGTPVLRLLDTSRAKLTVFLTKEDAQNLDKKTIFINGQSKNQNGEKYQFNKVWNVADEKYISSYRAEIILQAPERFSNLAKIELKEIQKATETANNSKQITFNTSKTSK
jgi:hypothetical protein